MGDASKVTVADIPFLAEGMDNFFGKLSGEVVERLKQVVADPKRCWDRDCGIILRMGEPGEGFGLGLTLWQAWIATDAAAPRVGPVTTVDKTTGRSKRGRWPKYPTREKLLKALEYAALTPKGPMA
jgi:hypothetical protein